MKKGYTLFTILIIAQIGFSQSLPFSTLRQVFNYAVGDSFEYQYGYQGAYGSIGNINSYSCGGYELMTITSASIAGDTLIYGYSYFSQDTGGTGPCSWFGVGGYPPFPPMRGGGPSMGTYDSGGVFRVIAPDSLVTYAWGPCVPPVVCSDTVVRDAMYNYHKQNQFADYYTESDDTDETLTDSIGLTSTYSAIVYVNFQLQLTWYHKAYGERWGTPVTIIPTGISNISNDAPSVKLFPNPSTGEFSIQLSGVPLPEFSFELFDASGRRVYQQIVPNELTNIRLNGISNGLYLWQLSNSGTVMDRGKLVLN